ncbi:hypothetical protein [Streptomyces sp. TRM64462]|uniref:hypothetical protein n=1 Tax=Streptomyces sp. TRM64462 TaxID=2741726 RepID=UPI00158687DD|nr:hypothetical protein [Streptomyces sp. TRM64462]
MGVTKKLSKGVGSASAALALAAHYFPEKDDEGHLVASFRHASFFFTGHLDLWDQWREMPLADKQRIAGVIRYGRQDFASSGVFTRFVRGCLAEQSPDGGIPFEAVGDPGSAVAARPRVGGDLLAHVDRMLERLSKSYGRRRAHPPADPGTWLTAKRYASGKGEIVGRAVIPATGTFTSGKDLDDLPEVNTLPYEPDLKIHTPDLLEHAREVDRVRYAETGKEGYLFDVLSKLFDELQTTDDISVGDALMLLAGPIEIFNAPTGTGKSVLVRVAASWLAVNGYAITLVLPTVEATLSAAWEIKEDLRALGSTKTCAPLMSPSRLHDRAMKLVSRIEGPLIGQDEETLWRLDTLSYGCALKHATTSTHPYPPGSESCRYLGPIPPMTGSRSCSWMQTCGKYEQQRQACEAAVVVTNHHNFMAGRFHIGVMLDGKKAGDLSVAEFVFRRSHAVLIDEVDQFQSVAVDMCSSELILDSRQRKSVPLRDLDDDQRIMSSEAVKELCPTISHARYLAEFLLAALCTDELHLRYYEGRDEAKDTHGSNSSMWHLSGSRDRRLITLLFPEEDVTDAQEIPAELFDKLNALHPVHPESSEDALPPGRIHDISLEPHLKEVREALGNLLASRGEDLLTQARSEMDRTLKDAVPNGYDRGEAIELLIVRVWLAELDMTLERLRGKTAQFKAAGLPSAQKLGEKLETGVASGILPYGMLGKGVFGYRVTGLDDPEKSAELTSQSISGDPHTYTAQLGGIVSLVLAGVERPVMGLSATAYFPQAVREHVHGHVKWWMTDADPESISAMQAPLKDALNHDIQISGLPQHLKSKALNALGEKLYTDRIHPELAGLLETDPDRAHVAVVVNSYEHCRHIAAGIYASGDYRDGLCVAVPPDKYRRDRLREAIKLPPGVIELTPEEFTTFPKRGKILVVPMARIARGLNIVIGRRSAITSVYLCTRPLALLTDPPEMYASINAAGINAVTPASDPLEVLQKAREAAWSRLRLIMRSAPGFVSAHKTLQEEIVAGMIVDMIQLAGRARRGGTDMTLHLVDYAFHNDSWKSDLKNILRRMHEKWTPDVRRRMDAIYREALAAFLAYAGINSEESEGH